MKTALKIQPAAKIFASGPYRVAAEQLPGPQVAAGHRFLKYLGEDLLRRAEHWHAVTTGRGQIEAGQRPPRDDPSRA